MPSLAELRADRAEKYATFSALLRDANGDLKEEMSTDEAQACEVLAQRIDALDDQIRAANHDRTRIAAMAVSANAPAGTTDPNSDETVDPFHRRSVDAAYGGRARATGHRFRLPSGEIVAALRPNESMEAAGRSRRPADRWGRDEGELNLSAMLGAVVFGDPSRLGRAEVQAMSGSIGTAGGLLIPPILSERIIDLARNQAVCVQAGAETLPMEAPVVSMAVVRSDPTPQWRAENQKIAESDATFGLVSLYAKSLAIIVPISLELVSDTANIEGLLMQQLASAFALELDRVVLDGSGITAQPKGLLRRTTIPNVAATGTADEKRVSFGKINTAFYAIKRANARGSVSTIYPWAFAETLDNLRTADGQLLEPPRYWSELGKFPTNQVPTTEADGVVTGPIITGDFSNVVIGMRENLLIEVARETNTYFEHGQVAVRAIARADVAVLRENHFHVTTGVTS